MEASFVWSLRGVEGLKFRLFLQRSQRASALAYYVVERGRRPLAEAEQRAGLVQAYLVFLIPLNCGVFSQVNVQ